jgi:hypothetical protein
MMRHSARMYSAAPIWVNISARQLSLIKQYEEQRRLSSDPREQRRTKRKIADLRAQLAGYEREQRELGCA